MKQEHIKWILRQYLLNQTHEVASSRSLSARQLISTTPIPCPRRLVSARHGIAESLQKKRPEAVSMGFWGQDVMGIETFQAEICQN